MNKFIGLLLLLLPLVVCAQTPEERGLEIALEADKRDAGFGDLSSNMVMTLKNANGDTSIRKMRSKALEVVGDGDKSLTIFDKPADVKGTAFLSFTHILEADDQWLYLPALKRVKRISSKNKSGPFMGSEFAFEDMTSFEVEKFSYTYVGDETINGEACFVLEQTPQYDYSGYTLQKVWIDKSHYRVHKVEFYDKKGALLKVLELKDYELYKDKYWRPIRSEMTNVQTRKSTSLITESLIFDTDLSESDFDKNSLKRAR